jgi:flagellar motor protein MotB
VKRILVRDFNLPADMFVVVGRGKTQLKSNAAPFAGENRRVQFVKAEAT